MEKSKNINRRDFFKQGIAMGAMTYTGLLSKKTSSVFAENKANKAADLVAVKNGEPDVMFDKAIEIMGGMSNFVKKDSTVVIKPNIGWNLAPETGANTNPILVKRIIEHSINAGAKKVYVFDHCTSDSTSNKIYKTSGIEAVAKDAGAIMAPGNSEKYYQNVEIPNAVKLKKSQVHELIMEADTFINVPVLKDHAGSRLTISMKNLMGIVWDRVWWHYNNLHQCIADFSLYRKPDLNVVDAYRVTMANGPQRARPDDIALKKSLILSSDIVAADAAAAKIYGIEPDQVRYIKLAHQLKVGEINLEALNIQKVVL